MWETIREYLIFTRKERFGVLFLLLIIIILFILPYFFRPRPGEPYPIADEKMRLEIQKFESEHSDSSRNTEMHYRPTRQKEDLADPDINGLIKERKLFYFDPNSLGSEGWVKLGMPGNLTQTILHFIERGGRFRKPEDLKKIYGMRPAEYARLFPYIRIHKEPETTRSRSGNYTKEINNAGDSKKAGSFIHSLTTGIRTGPYIPHESKKLVFTDINKADSLQWSRLPGIGAKLASRIIHFRERLGGFCRVDQVGETFGLPDSTFQKIRPALLLNPEPVTCININSASKESLQLHPYIRWQIAKAIVDYRNQHGGFRSVDELMQLALMDSGKFEKLKPYLTVNP